MSESTLFTTLSTNEEANLSGGGGGKSHGGKSGGGDKTIIAIGGIYGNANIAGNGDATYYDYSKSKGHH